MDLLNHSGIVKDKYRYSIIVLVFTAMIFFQNTPASAQADCWGNFRGDAALKGVSGADLPGSLSLLWSFKTNDAIKAPPVVCGNIVVVGSVDGNIYGVDMEGKLVWKINTGNSIEAPAMIIGNRAFVGDLDGALHAIDVQSGRVLWTYVTEGQIMGSANYFRKGPMEVIVVGSYDYYLHGVDANTGKELWKFESDNFINGAAAIYNGKAVFGGCDGLLHQVDVSTGIEKSSQEVATYVASSVAVDRNRAYVGDYDGQFTCLDLVSSGVVWNYSNSEVQLPFIGSPSISEEQVFIGNRDKYMYCFNRENGNLDWKVNTRGRVDASPVLVGKRIVVATMRGDLLLMNQSDGEITWSYELGTPIAGNPAVIDDHVIVGGQDGRIYCFGKK